MFKSDVKGNDSIVGYSAKSAPTGIYVKQIICSDENWCLPWIHFLIKISLSIKSIHQPDHAHSSDLWPTVSPNKLCNLCQIRTINPLLSRIYSRHPKLVQNGHKLAVHICTSVWPHCIVKRFELKKILSFHSEILLFLGSVLPGVPYKSCVAPSTSVCPACLPPHLHLPFPRAVPCTGGTVEGWESRLSRHCTFSINSWGEGLRPAQEHFQASNPFSHLSLNNGTIIILEIK